jgi:hypothetical protein
MPEPGPVGVNVDPLGEPLGASAFPDGFVLLGPIRPEVAEPVELPAVPPVVFPLNDEPVVVPPVTEPPAEPPPAVPPLLCASANVLESASAPANAIVVILMVVSLVGGEEKPAEAIYVPPPAALEETPQSQRPTSIAAPMPASCAPTNPMTPDGAMPAKVSESERAIVTAGLANEVEAVNQ